MPEMPELEHFKTYFNRTSVHKKIDRVRCKNKSLLKGGSLAAINKKLKGKEFKRATRRGKFLIAPLTNSDDKVVFHFGLTGFLHYKTAKDPKGEPFAQVIFVFLNGDELQWINKRKFGRVYVVSDVDKIKTIKTMGPEASTITKKAFSALLAKRERSNVKTFLMDQTNIAGIGNEYSNEILFEAGISPKHTIGDLSTSQRTKLYSTMKRVLKKAAHLPIVEREIQFPKSWLLEHTKDMRCPKNKKHTLKKITIGGRSAYFCPICQT